MAIYEFEGRTPRISPTAYVAPSAQVIGDVVIGEECYVGHGAILRGDYGTIEVGDGTAVEEGVIVHARPEDKTVFGKRVTLGHGAMIHNAVVRDEALAAPVRDVLPRDREVARRRELEQARELADTQARAAKTSRQFMIGVAVLAALASGLAVQAFRQWQKAEHCRAISGRSEYDVCFAWRW
mgnify:CR=1 FL=1